jgi:hypothetical protein
MSPWVVANARAMLGLPHIDILAAHMQLSTHAHPSAVTVGMLQLARAKVRIEQAGPIDWPSWPFDV